MKLLLLHGPAKAASRKKLIDLKQKFDQNSVVVFEEGSAVQTILGSLSTPSLFSDERLIILENPAEDIANFPLSASPFTLILWFDHEVTSKKPVMDWAKKVTAEILFFPEAREVSVFPFLDFLANQDQKAFLELQKLKKAGFDIQYLLTMVFYLLRSLAVTPKNAPQFVKEKLAKQRRNFNAEKIIKLYREILEIDFKIKSGLLDLSQAEFLLVNKFIDSD